jgi:hypothetical protein
MKKILGVIIILFAIIGLIFSGVFVALRYGLLNVRGTISDRNAAILGKARNGNTKITDPLLINRAVFLCKIHTLANYAPQTAQAIDQVFEVQKNIPLSQTMMEIAQQRFSNDMNFLKENRACDQVIIPDTTPLAQTAYIWADSDEWAVMKSAFIRDQEYINQAARDAGISPRLLLGGIIGEQFRFFTNRRDSFKQYFEPLKILASLSSFSYGIAGLKPETVKRIDDQLHNPESVFYLGPEMENIVTYPENSDHDKVRFERITDTKNTYYSYLYAGLFMRQVITQWKASGFDISNRPEVLATLYNLGFNRSIPKENPGAGGAPIIINNVEYNFGTLAYQFYYSGELMQEFPY